jgi:hypothetical protein
LDSVASHGANPRTSSSKVDQDDIGVFPHSVEHDLLAIVGHIEGLRDLIVPQYEKFYRWRRAGWVEGVPNRRRSQPTLHSPFSLLLFLSLIWSQRDSGCR